MLNTYYIPEMNLTVYKKTKGQTYNNAEFYLEVSDFIQTSENKYKPSNPRPLDRKDLTGLKRFLNNQDYASNLKYNGIQDINVIYLNPDIDQLQIILFIPEGLNKLHFTSANKLDTANYYTPNMLVKYTNSGMKIYIVKEDRLNLTESTELYLPPFNNITSDHSMCSGNITIKKDFKSVEHYIQYVKDFFFNSNFSSVHKTHLKNEQTLEEFWKKHLNAKSFDYKSLIKSKLTIKDILS